MVKTNLAAIIAAAALLAVLAGCAQGAQTSPNPSPSETAQSSGVTDNAVSEGTADPTGIDPASIETTVSMNYPDLNAIQNTKYPEIVARVGDTEITGLQLTKEIVIQKCGYISLRRPQSDDFYEKVSLGFLIKNVLINKAVALRGMLPSPEEAKAYLDDQKKQMDALYDGDPAKVAYMDSLKEQGFDNSDDYVHSPAIVVFTQNLLGGEKLKAAVEQEALKTQNTNYKAWENYTNQLIAGADYQIFIPVDITGFQELEDKAAMGGIPWEYGL